jgi:hypothetical protein
VKINFRRGCLGILADPGSYDFSMHDISKLCWVRAIRHSVVMQDNKTNHSTEVAYHLDQMILQGHRGLHVGCNDHSGCWGSA